MNKRKSSPRQDHLDAKAIEAALDAQSLPPGPERTEALRRRKSSATRPTCTTIPSPGNSVRPNN